jgi:hypothetical protein
MASRHRVADRHSGDTTDGYRSPALWTTLEIGVSVLGVGQRMFWIRIKSVPEPAAMKGSPSDGRPRHRRCGAERRVADQVVDLSHHGRRCVV